MAEVWFVPLKDGASPAAQARAVKKVLEASRFVDRLRRADMVMVKVHVGEKRNITHVKPELVAQAVKLLKSAGAQPFLTDTATLYKGERENGIKHALHAHKHGFSVENTGAPFLPVDGLSGIDEKEVRINGELHKTVKVAGQALLADAMLVISHPTGHMGTGLGAAIKNVGMGLASRAGKMRQHSSIKPEVEPEKCEFCKKCMKWCPQQAIIAKEGAAYIRLKKCIGCGECIAVCRYGAIKYDYKIESRTLQKSMSEHAAALVRHFNGKAFYINVLVDMTKDCDCLNTRQEKIIPDVGVVGSYDIVAVDQASLDLTREAEGKNLGRLSYPRLDPEIQIAHAEKLKLGKRKYKLVKL